MWGTSPRMRGKPEDHAELAKAQRNIPAYAGKTACRRRQAARCWEHPRVCGENKGLKKAFFGNHGTSPRMRGKLDGAGGGHQAIRNIPAYAGKTLASMVTVRHHREHPRVCGENAA